MLVEKLGRYYHNYKNVEIERVEKHYAQGNEVSYKIDGVSEIFYKLKDAKQYIDKYMGS
jgi:adenosine deaminase